MEPLEILKKGFDFNLRTFELNLKDLTDDDAAYTQDSKHNSMIWIYDHLLNTRRSMMEKAGRTDMASRINWENTFESQVKEFRKSQNIVHEFLDSIDPANEFALTKLQFLLHHEAYHLGQIGIIRKLAGKEGVIKPPKS